ncbi:MAG: hypothetical protein JWP46_3689 [Modestobacter sp.]|jgi:hypothetical protein|nr:hypothetical protein [Modestobacter sp.]
MPRTGDARLIWARELLNEIGPVWHRLTLPLHVAARVAALLHGETLRFVDSTIDIDEDLAAHGQVIVWTDRHVAAVRLIRVGLDDPTDARSPAEKYEYADVTVTVLPRSALRKVVIEGPGPAVREVSINSGSVWQGAPGSTDWSWPPLGQLSLYYKGFEGRLLVPAKGRASAGFDVLVDELMADLPA